MAQRNSKKRMACDPVGARNSQSSAYSFRRTICSSRPQRSRPSTGGNPAGPSSGSGTESEESYVEDVVDVISDPILSARSGTSENNLDPPSGSKNNIQQPQGTVHQHISRCDSDGNIRFSCNYCKKQWIYTEEEFKRRGSSTSNQLKHVRTVHSRHFNGNTAVGPMDGYIATTSEIEKRLATNVHISDDLIREGIENFVMAEMEPFTLVESETFLTLLKLCIKCKRENVFIPKADALKNGVMKRTLKMKEDLKKSFSNASSAVHLCLDMWTSPNMFSFLAVTAHFIDSDWNLVERLLTFQDTTDHTGAGMAALVKETMVEFDFAARLGCLTMDNASNNDTLVSALSQHLQEISTNGINGIPAKWDPIHSRIRCLPHVINLAAQAFLKAFGDEDTLLVSDDDVPDVSSSNILKRLRYIVKKLRSSPSQRKQFLGQCELANVERLMLILDVRTRWNSTFYMIQRAVKVRCGMQNWLRTDPEIGRAKLGCMQFCQDEWERLERVSCLLEMFENASKLMSGEKYPTLSFVMPIFIELFTFIERQVQIPLDDPMLGPLNAAHAVLAKYYSFTDDSHYYLLAVLLDPRFKTKYLKRKGFDIDYPGLIEQTVVLLKDLVKAIQRSKETGEETLSNNVMSDNTTLFTDMFAHCFAEAQGHMNEVDTYLSLHCEDPNVDPVYYWKAHSMQFPLLSIVAKNVLSIPGSSVAVERIFNCGRDMIGLRRQSLKPETMSALMFGRSTLKSQ
uniref:HAT C-terminal dimerisation domain-containing protein n=1 Tax=Spongospora subterranea TaxID=70186 RepID=A0A0H5QWQ6_9EUKA|eukprot:CRZ06066.1 hypothetical protein [Spongospora subterranea]